MIQYAVTTLRQKHRSTNWKLVLGDLFGMMVTLTGAFMLTGYLSLWEFATDEWTVESLGFGVGGSLSALTLAILVALVTAPVFYSLWRVIDHRYGDRRVPQEIALWLGLGIGLPTVAMALLAASNPLETIELISARDGGPVFERGTATTYYGGAMLLALFPTVFTGVYHRVSLGDWTLRTRQFHAILAIVAVVLAAAVGASVTLTSTDAATDSIVSDEYDDQNVAAYHDGLMGPSFFASLNGDESYGEYRPGAHYACEGFAAPEVSPTDYDPVTVHAAPEDFEVALGQLTTDNGTVTLPTRLSVRLSKATLDNATVIQTGVYNAEYNGANATLYADPSYDEPDDFDLVHYGATVQAENIDSAHLYVDVIRNGEVHRYVTTLCPQEASDGA